MKILYFCLPKTLSMLINELSKKTGLTIYTIRYYENLGLIAGCRNEEVKSNNYKDYNNDVVERIKIIKDVQGIGFTLAEIKKMFDDCYGGNLSGKERIDLFNNKIQEIEIKIKHFREIRSRLICIMKNMENIPE
ncbi:MerR family transcriptional regulator [Chryseobacterium sp. JJR-5R]|uniref:MerR family transcriptional regulator n=1 Tax=Chryseobacterium sp. JJR-5R TaxID=3093923 RepID=UPI002A756F23|nr:MerR family transcriptional regulator [Chryseobacterium sp. JJR-5R]WPO84167.1 MerR family transcriptional regulator [Chryseobacterium sp. JJR-5R]